MVDLARLDFTEALKDSPHFRLNMKLHEDYVEILENKLKTIRRLSLSTMDQGKAYVSSFTGLTAAVDDLNKTCFSQEPLVYPFLTNINDSLQEVAKFQKILIEQIHWTLIKNLNDFLRREINKIHEIRSHFDKVSRSLDDALIKNSQIHGNKEQESREALNEIIAVGTCFSHTSLDYVFQLNLIKAKKNEAILDLFSSFVHACQTFFHQGHTYFTDWEQQNTETLDKTMKGLKDLSAKEERRMQDRHLLVPKELFQHPTGMPIDPHAVMEGYLFKRASNAFKTWNRRWFMIRANQLLYCHRGTASEPMPGAAQDKHRVPERVTDDGYTVMESDLRLCLVRPIKDPGDHRQHCFELITPNKTHVLQADSSSLCNAWVKALQRSIESAIHETDGDNCGDPSTSGSGSLESEHSTKPDDDLKRNPSNTSPSKTVMRALSEIGSLLGNDHCADCGSHKPAWASINIGVTLCIQCCGIHRSLGVHVSKIRSLTLDSWEPVHIRLMRAMGNNHVNSILLKYLPHETPVPPPATPSSSMPVREAWIKAKYIEKRFTRPSKEWAKLLQNRWQKKSSIRHHHISDHIPENDMPPAAVATRTKSLSSNASKRTTQFLAPVREESTLVISIKRNKSNPDFLKLSQHKTQVSEENSTSLEKLNRDRLTRISSCGSETDLFFYSEDSDHFLTSDELNRAMLRACASGDIEEISRLFILGADVNCKTPPPDDVQPSSRSFTSPIHQAVLSGSVECSEYLLLNNAKINVADSEMQTPLHLAVMKGLTNHVCQLLKRKSMFDLKNIDGKTPLDIAIELAHADIVTVIRLAKLNKETEDSESSNSFNTMLGVMHDMCGDESC